MIWGGAPPAVARPRSLAGGPRATAARKRWSRCHCTMSSPAGADSRDPASPEPMPVPVPSSPAARLGPWAPPRRRPSSPPRDGLPERVIVQSPRASSEARSGGNRRSRRPARSRRRRPDLCPVLLVIGRRVRSRSRRSLRPVPRSAPGDAVGQAGRVAEHGPSLEAGQQLGTGGDVRGHLRLAVGRRPVEVGGDGVLLVVQPLEQELQRLLRARGEPAELRAGLGIPAFQPVRCQKSSSASYAARRDVEADLVDAGRVAVRPVPGGGGWRRGAVTRQNVRPPGEVRTDVVVAGHDRGTEPDRVVHGRARVVDVDVEVHPGRPVADPLDPQVVVPSGGTSVANSSWSPRGADRRSRSPPPRKPPRRRSCRPGGRGTRSARRAHAPLPARTRCRSRRAPVARLRGWRAGAARHRVGRHRVRRRR